MAFNPNVDEGPPAWVNMLPGHPGAAQEPSWSSPQGYYDYIMANVPGISPEAASWLHAQVLGGHPIGGQTADWGAGGTLPHGGLTPAQMAAIMLLPGGMAGASTVQPGIPGGAQYGQVGGPVVPGTPGQVGWTNPNDPVLNPTPPTTTTTAGGFPPDYTQPSTDPNWGVPPGWVPDLDPTHGTPVTVTPVTPGTIYGNTDFSGTWGYGQPGGVAAPPGWKPNLIPPAPHVASRVRIRHNHPEDVPYR